MLYMNSINKVHGSKKWKHVHLSKYQRQQNFTMSIVG